MVSTFGLILNHWLRAIYSTESSSDEEYKDLAGTLKEDDRNNDYQTTETRRSSRNAVLAAMEDLQARLRIHTVPVECMRVLACGASLPLTLWRNLGLELNPTFVQVDDDVTLAGPSTPEEGTAKPQKQKQPLKRTQTRESLAEPARMATRSADRRK